MPRKSPYRHPVRSHTRDGVKVSNYVRGDGQPPTKNPANNKKNNLGKWVVQWSFPGKPDEVVMVGGGTLTEAVRNATGKFRTPAVPDRARVGKT